MNRLQIFFLMAALFSFCSVTSADLILKMECSDYQIGIGQEAVISIYGMAEQASGTNGLNSWNLDMVVDVGGVVEASAVARVAPSPWDSGMPLYLALNDEDGGNWGDVIGLGVATQAFPQSSTIGVGKFDKLAEITIVGMAAGQVTYTLGDFGGMGFEGYLSDYTNEPGSFLAGNNVITVVPEPCTLAMMTIMAVTAALGRRRK
jgi:hypothetical protein